MIIGLCPGTKPSGAFLLQSQFPFLRIALYQNRIATPGAANGLPKIVHKCHGRNSIAESV
jgi:hypothetical protein